MNRFWNSLLVAGATGGAMFAATTATDLRDHGSSASPVTAGAPTEALDTAARLSDAFAWAADQVRPAVVTVLSTQNVAAQMAPGFAGPQGLDDMLRQFGFHFAPDPRDGSQLPPQAEVPRFERRGEGSGVIVRDDGVILTNNHVVANADELKVRLEDDREYDAKVLGTDPMSDLAVLKIEAKDLPVAHFGDSDQMRVGDWVIAVGNPLGLEDTITAGIISAKGRSNVHITEFEDFLQTDAAINPGNSGGPLIDLHGAVVGINTAIASQTGGFQGVGFAIPANMAKTVMQQLVDHGEVRRGLLGVLIQPLDPELAQSFGYEGHGVVVSEVVEGGAAAKAGVQVGDIVRRFAGKEVTDPKDLQRRVAECEPGKSVEVEIVRGGETKSLEVTLGERDATSRELRPLSGREADELGLGLQDLSGKEARALGLDDDLHGVLITDVQSGSIASRAGLRPGDVVLQVQGESVADTHAFLESMKRHSLEDGVRVLVLSDGHRRFVVLRKS